MQITNEEIKQLFGLFKELQTTKVERREYEIWEQIQAENRSHIEFLHWLKTHYPEALVEWDALNKIREA